MSDTANTQQQPKEQAQQDQDQINIIDIANLVKIVDYAADQGAFKGFTTMRQVIEVRDRVAAFVDSVLPAQENQDQ